MNAYTIRNEDDVFSIIDEMGNYVESFCTKLEALAMLKDLNTPEVVSAVRRIEGTYGREELPEVAEKSVVENSEPEFQAPVAIVTVEAKGSKADQVRACIVQVKQQGGNMQQAVVWAMENLGMKKALAGTYVKNNWNNV